MYSKELPCQDQATTLRRWAQRRQASAVAAAGPAQVIAVASGKGGVGKTALVANLAVAFAQLGIRVLAVDGDLGLANLDIALGVVAPRTVLDVMHGRCNIEEALVLGPAEVMVLPACSGRFDLANLSETEQYNLFSAIDGLDDHFDMLLIDTPAGLGANGLGFASAAQDVVVVANSEPTSLADAYAFVKVLRSRHGVKTVHLVANMVRSVVEGEQIYHRLANLLDRFLDVSVDYLGCISQDYWVPRALRAGVPLLLHRPTAPASQCIMSIARKLRQPGTPHSGGGIRLFWRRLVGSGTLP